MNLNIKPVIFSLLLFSLLDSSMTSCRGNRNGNRHSQNTEESESERRHSNRSHVSDRRGNQSNSTKRVEMEGKDVFKKCGNAVFMIFTSDGESGFQGSGFFINSSGLAVSNYHVFKGTYRGLEQIKFPNDNRAYKIKNVIAKSEKEDFILFTVDCNGTVPYIPIAKTRPSIGEKVFAIGSPRGLENTFSSGEVSQWRDKNLMQISALIDHGSSGGALINAYGEAVGITSGTFYDGSQANLNYAWSIDVIKKYLK